MFILANLRSMAVLVVQKAGEGRETARRLGPNRALSSLYTGFLRKEEGTLDTSVIHWLMKYL